MREKIAKVIANWGSMPQGSYNLALDEATQILTLLKQEIKKVENPYNAEELPDYHFGFDLACKKVLKILEPMERE